MTKQFIIRTSVLTGVLATSATVHAGPTYIEQRREISLSIPQSRGVPVTERVSTVGVDPFNQTLSRDQRLGDAPSNDDGAYGLVRQDSYLESNGLYFGGRIEADTIYSTDGTSSGVAADIASTIQVRMRIDELTKVTLDSFVTSFDNLRPDPLTLTARIENQDGDSVLEHFNFGSDEQNRTATLEPGEYTISASAVPQGYIMDGQWSYGDYWVNVRFASLLGGGVAGPMVTGRPASGGAGSVAVGAEVIPLPGQAWTGLAMLGAIAVLVMRSR